MGIKKMKTVNLAGPVSRFQDNVETVLDVVTDKLILDGVLLKNISLEASTTNMVNHGLGRVPIGWFITRKRAQSDIWDLQDVNTTPSRNLALACSDDVTIDLWVF